MVLQRQRGNMTREEIVKEARQLPLAEREAAVEEITRSIREEMQPQQKRVSIVDRLYGIAKSEDPSSQTVENLGENKLTISQRLSGSLKLEAGAPTDEEVKDMIAEYLLEKNS